jgi:uncharacterized protein YciI
MDFAVLRERGPAWDVAHRMREQDAWPEHAAFMVRLAESGFVLLGGPIGNGEKFLFLIRADGKEDVCAQLSHDPWVPLQMLGIVAIEPWEIFWEMPKSTSSFCVSGAPRQPTLV